MKNKLESTFSLLVLTILKTSSKGGMQASEIADEAWKLLNRRVDSAQVHIALNRLQKRGLAKKGQNRIGIKKNPFLWAITEKGESALKETLIITQKISSLYIQSEL